MQASISRPFFILAPNSVTLRLFPLSTSPFPFPTQFLFFCAHAVSQLIVKSAPFSFLPTQIFPGPPPRPTVGFFSPILPLFGPPPFWLVPLLPPQAVVTRPLVFAFPQLRWAAILSIVRVPILRMLTLFLLLEALVSRMCLPRLCFRRFFSPPPLSSRVSCFTRIAAIPLRFVLFGLDGFSPPFSADSFPLSFGRFFSFLSSHFTYSPSFRDLFSPYPAPQPCSRSVCYRLFFSIDLILLDSFFVRASLPTPSQSLFFFPPPLFFFYLI